jgi:hypothetical protein
MRLLASIVVGASLVGLATMKQPLAQTSLANSILVQHHSAVVQLQVQGKINNASNVENGTGFLLSTAQGPRIITAGHVVGPDDRWDSLDDRLIYYRVSMLGSSLTLEPVTDAKVDLPQLDMAQVYLDPFQAPTLQIAAAPAKLGEQLIVLSWRGWGSLTTRPTAQNAQVLQSDNDRLVLSGSYVRSDSGSPVLNGDGQLVGMLIEATSLPSSGTQGLALPVAELMPSLSQAIASPIGKTPVLALADLAKQSEWGWMPGPQSKSAQLPEKEGCVFLGKRSASASAALSDMPFGASLIGSLRNNEARDRLVGQRLQVRTEVNLRSRCPTVMDGIAYYGAVTAHLEPLDTVIPTKIAALNYLDDVFYWAEASAIATSKQSSPAK